MAAKFWLSGAVVLIPLLVPISGQADTQPSKAKAPSAEQALIIEEAEAVVELYDERLHNVKLQASQEDLKWNQVKENYLRVDEAHRSGAISEHAFRDAKYEYDYWTMQDQVQDIQEAETNLKLAKIRLKMARAGMRPYGKICDLGRE